MSKRIDFDDYADGYEAELQAQLAFFAPERDYFSAYKVEILRRIIRHPVGSVLDFGAGVGLSIPSLRRAFPQAELCATDISEASLAHLQQQHPEVRSIPDAALDQESFDLIFLASVLHHVDPGLRTALVARLRRLLAPGGSIAIFEHNPLNPVTRHLVSTCAFDADAVLLPLRETVALATGAAKLRVRSKGYSLFFPHPLRALRSLEPFLRWLPLGGQYYVVAG